MNSSDNTTWKIWHKFTTNPICFFNQGVRLRNSNNDIYTALYIFHVCYLFPVLCFVGCLPQGIYCDTAH